MNRDDIIRIAREAGLIALNVECDPTYAPIIERFAALVAAAEREACAKVCKKEEATLLHQEALTLPQGDPMLIRMASVAHFCAAAIRARGET